MAEHKYLLSHTQTAMSHEDFLDDETGTILASEDSDDSKESIDSDKKKVKPEKKPIQWETNTEEDPDDNW